MIKSYVYLMTCPERFKIGHTYDPQVRRTALRYETKLDLTLAAMFVGSRTDEAETHARFSDHRIEGEWFDPADEIVEWFESRDDFIFPGKPYYPNFTPARDLVIKYVGTGQRDKPAGWNGIPREHE